MPLLSIARFITTLISLVILGLAAYLVWRWYQGDLIPDAEGNIVRIRDARLLWIVGGLGLFSIMGRLPLGLLLARPDRGEPSIGDRGPGQFIEQPNGSRIFVEEVGLKIGPTLILTHGWAMDSTIWHYAKRFLSQRYRVIVWDLPGLGQSKGAISLENFAACLAAVIEWSGAEKVVLVGHSIGGMTIQTLARDHAALFAHRVAGIALLNTTYTNPLKTMILPRVMQAIRWPLIEPIMWLSIILLPLTWLSAWQSYLSGMTHLANRIGFGKYVTRSQLNHVSLLSTKNSPASIDKGNLAMFRWDATGALRNVNVPILLLAGDLDIVTKLSASQELASQAPNASLQVIEGVNHMGMLEQADRYNMAVSEFAERALAQAKSPLGVQR